MYVCMCVCALCVTWRKSNDNIISQIDLRFHIFEIEHESVGIQVDTVL